MSHSIFPRAKVRSRSEVICCVSYRYRPIDLLTCDIYKRLPPVELGSNIHRLHTGPHVVIMTRLLISFLLAAMAAMAVSGKSRISQKSIRILVKSSDFYKDNWSAFLTNSRFYCNIVLCFCAHVFYCKNCVYPTEIL